MWTKLSRKAKFKTNAITLALAGGERFGSSFIVSMPEALELGFCRDQPVDVMVGRGVDEGKLKIEPASDGAFKVMKFHKSFVVRFPVPPGVTLNKNKDAVEYVRLKGHAQSGIIITLPDWARPGEYAAVSEDGSAAPDASKPGSLEINGNALMMGGKHVRLARGQAALMGLLAERFGKCVSRNALIKVIKQHDPVAEASPKSLDVIMSTLRKILLAEKLALAIVTHRGVGYELRRPVAD